MKLCTSHYTDLRRAIQNKGMTSLIQDVASLPERAERWLHGCALQSDGFDPLMVSMLEIYKKAAEEVGTHLHMVKPNGEHYCPLCELPRVQGNEAPGAWIDNCTDMMLLICETNGIKLSR